MLVRNNSVCRTSKGLRGRLEDDKKNELIKREVVLPDLPRGAQFVRPDFTYNMKTYMLDFVNSCMVHHMLRGPLFRLIDLAGPSLFKLTTFGQTTGDGQSEMVIPRNRHGISAYGGTCKTKEGQLIYCNVTPREKVIAPVKPNDGTQIADDSLRVSADMAVMTYFKASGVLPDRDIYKHYIFVCDPAGAQYRAPLVT